MMIACCGIMLAIFKCVKVFYQNQCSKLEMCSVMAIKRVYNIVVHKRKSSCHNPISVLMLLIFFKVLLKYEKEVSGS